MLSAHSMAVVKDGAVTTEVRMRPPLVVNAVVDSKWDITRGLHGMLLSCLAPARNGRTERGIER